MKVFIFTASIILLSIFFICSNSPTDINGYPNDTFMMLDGAWRMFNGQTANKDFISPLGPLTYYLISIGMLITAGKVSAIAYSSLLMIGLCLLFIPLLKGRLSNNWIAALYLVLSILIITPRPMNSQVPYFVTNAMNYNRWGFALFSILFIHLLLPLNFDKAGKRQFFSIFLSGLLLAFLFTLKINYFLIALTAYLTFRIPEVKNIRSYMLEASACMLSAGVCILCLSYIMNFSIFGYLRDIQYASGIQISAFRIINFHHGIQFAIELLIFYLLMMPLIYMTGVRGKTLVHLTFICLFTLAMGLSFLFYNSEEKELFILRILLPVILVKFIPADLEVLRKVSVLFSSAFVLVFLCRDLATLFYISLPKDKTYVQVRAYDSENWKITDDYYENYLKTGADFIKAAVTDDKPVFVTDFTDPFSFLLKRKPVKHSLVWWHNNVTFNPQKFPDIDLILCDAGWIATPKKPRVGRERDVIRGIISKSMSKQYTFHSDTEFWEIYKRTSECPS